MLKWPFFLSFFPARSRWKGVQAKSAFHSTGDTVLVLRRLEWKRIARGGREIVVCVASFADGATTLAIRVSYVKTVVEERGVTGQATRYEHGA